jgi:hypothetical protein
MISALGAAACPGAWAQDRLERAVEPPAREAPPVFEGRPVRDLSRDPAEARLLVKGDGFAVHALAGAFTNNAFLQRPIHGGITLMHTDLESGRMTYLIGSGVWEVPTRRISYSRTNLLGIAADDERLYVASWSSGRVFDEAPSPWSPLEGGQFTLTVFRLADGKSVYQDSIKLSAEQVAAIDENTRQLSHGDLSLLWTHGSGDMKPTQAGDVQLIEGGVSAYGHLYKFDGADLKEKSAAPKDDTKSSGGESEKATLREIERVKR